MDERRVHLLTALLRPVLVEELPPDAAGSRGSGPSADLVTLVHRFVQGAPPQSVTEAIPPSSVNPSRRARLRELQHWGVDLSLIEGTLAQTPAVCIANMERQLLLVRQLQHAKRGQEVGR